jgi:3'-phosphoadenosine 5'-phosphosulfate (PAPS) 3'-phosphatase
MLRAMALPDPPPDPTDGGARDRDALVARWRPRLQRLQRAIRERLRISMREQDLEAIARPVRETEGDDADTIFALDVAAEELLDELCNEWAREEAFVLVGEGVEPSGSRTYGEGTPTARLIVDPIDGTRGLMFDKRSAWCLAAVAPERGPTTSLRHIELAAMAELPTTRQNLVDDLVAVRGRGVVRTRRNLDAPGSAQTLPVRPSRATTLRHGFATVCSFFQGGKELIARIDEDLMHEALGGWRPDKADVYGDHYISSGGQLAEIALGRDRFVLDVRPEVHSALGHPSTLCSRPYDLCTALVATEAGALVLRPDGRPLDAPLDTTTNLSFVAYANRALHDALQPVVQRVLQQHGLVG